LRTKLRIFCPSSIGRSWVDRKIRRSVWEASAIVASSPAHNEKPNQADTRRIFLLLPKPIDERQFAPARTYWICRIGASKGSDRGAEGPVDAFDLGPRRSPRRPSPCKTGIWQRHFVLGFTESARSSRLKLVSQRVGQVYLLSRRDRAWQRDNHSQR